MSKKKTPGTHYPVGYCKPPTHSQFQKGQSGNPRGRKPGVKNKTTDSKLYRSILDEAKRIVSVQDQHGQQTMPMLQVVLRSLFAVAAKGNLKAQKVVLECVKEAEALLFRVEQEARPRAVIIDDICECSVLEYKRSKEARDIQAKGSGDLNKS